MYTRISIDHFRGLKNLELLDLGHVNLITGPNNAGKTTVLEAIFVQAGGASAISMATTTEAMRGAKGLNVDLREGGASPWDSYFFNFDTSHPIEFETLSDRQEVRKVQIHLPYATSTLTPALPDLGASVTAGAGVVLRSIVTDVWEGTHKDTYQIILDPVGLRIDPPAPVPKTLAVLQVSGPLNHAQLATQFTRLVETGNRKRVVAALRLLDDRISDLELLVYGGQTMVHVHISGNSRPLPLHLVGEGTAKLLQSLINIQYASNGVVCIDELDNGIYFQNMPQVWKIVTEFATANDTQLFVTTHSHESLTAAASALDGTNNLRVVRLVREDDGDISAFPYDEEALKGALAIGLDVR